MKSKIRSCYGDDKEVISEAQNNLLALKAASHHGPFAKRLVASRNGPSVDHAGISPPNRMCANYCCDLPSSRQFSRGR
ncbi:hypothetical protein TIFTF001_030094 [Ficus carica]|uniref:Uncharacterized protein n=1 Tax=Ficus carica TaxID=3494 RepID=A0AA88DTJ9_FICCA|nr:hypothetical protein TIFTF001_030094 [Ficus carica]